MGCISPFPAFYSSRAGVEEISCKPLTCNFYPCLTGGLIINFALNYLQAQKYELNTVPSHTLPANIQPEPPVKKQKVIEVDYSKDAVNTESERGKIQD